MRNHCYYVYIIANATRILYTGITNNLVRRVWEHKTRAIDGFTSHFHVCRLVYYESFDDVHKAIAREKQIKRWRREKKIWADRAGEPQLERPERGLVPRYALKALPLDSC
jgi:putative endonuclease